MYIRVLCIQHMSLPVVNGYDYRCLLELEGFWRWTFDSGIGFGIGRWSSEKRKDYRAT